VITLAVLNELTLVISLKFALTETIVKIVYSIVTNEVLVVEEETVETETVSKLEVIVYAPLILSIDTSLVESYTCCRVSLTVITVSKTYNLRSCTVEEVIKASVTIVTCTVSHVRVVSHLVLIVDTSCELVVTSVVSEVILDRDVSVVNTVVPCEELVSESDVRKNCATVVVTDVDEWEVLRVSTTHVIELRECCEELVREVVAETAVEVE
jgi:hypothetical protein